MTFPSRVHSAFQSTQSALKSTATTAQAVAGDCVRAVMSRLDSIEIQESTTTSGERSWHVCDRKRNKQRTFTSKTDLNIWLDCRTYH